jgi:phosphoribosylformylglycinamidine synthase subunit PurS
LPKIVVQVMPKQDLLDPQGKAVARALSRSGHKDITAVRIGKRIELHYATTPTDAQLEEAKQIAESFLSNGVIEDVVEVFIEQD